MALEKQLQYYSPQRLSPQIDRKPKKKKKKLIEENESRKLPNFAPESFLSNEPPSFWRRLFGKASRRITCRCFADRCFEPFLRRNITVFLEFHPPPLPPPALARTSQLDTFLLFPVTRKDIQCFRWCAWLVNSPAVVTLTRRQSNKFVSLIGSARWRFRLCGFLLI